MNTKLRSINPSRILIFFSLHIGLGLYQLDHIDGKEVSHKILSPYYFHGINEVFKPLTVDYLYSLYDANPECQEELDNYFKIEKKWNEKKASKVVAYSLFWSQNETASYENIFKKRTFKGKESSFFEHYVKPLMSSARYFKEHERKTVVRIYLSQDLKCLIPYLDAANVEIFLMACSSIGHSPGAMWRFLVFGDADIKMACIHDADDYENERYIRKANDWLSEKQSKGFYRLYNQKGKEDLNTVNYSPILAGRFGAKNWRFFDIEKAMKGYILHRTLYLDEPRHPRDVPIGTHIYGWGNQFPSYGFDERFLKHVLFYYAADSGQLTTVLMKSAQKDEIYEYIKWPCNYLVQKDFAYVLQRNPQALYSH
jgi:hypothetical protein